MSTKKLTDKDRDEEAIRYYNEGTPGKGIAVRVGWSTDTANLRRNLSRLGLKPNTKSEPAIYGLTKNSKQLRNRIANYADPLIDSLGDVGFGLAVGLTDREQNKVKKRHGNLGTNYHDWTLAQLERLAEASGVSFTVLLRKIVSDY